LKKKHPDITEEQTQIYIEKHLQEPELRTNFSIQCPESECQGTLCCSRKDNLKPRLFTHISTEHSENKDNHSKKSIATYVNNNYKQTVVSAGEQLNTKKKRKTNK